MLRLCLYCVVDANTTTCVTMLCSLGHNTTMCCFVHSAYLMVCVVLRFKHNHVLCCVVLLGRQCFVLCCGVKHNHVCDYVVPSGTFVDT